MRDTRTESLPQAPEFAAKHLRRIKLDTFIGLAFSNVVAFFVILTAAATLGVHGINDIQSSAQAAEALRPIAGEFASSFRAAHHRHRYTGHPRAVRLGRVCRHGEYR